MKRRASVAATPWIFEIFDIFGIFNGSSRNARGGVEYKWSAGATPRAVSIAG